MGPYTASSSPWKSPELPVGLVPWPAPEDLVVDLGCTDSDVVLPVRCLLLHLREEQLQRPLVDAWVVRGSLGVEGKGALSQVFPAMAEGRMTTVISQPSQVLLPGEPPCRSAHPNPTGSNFPSPGPGLTIYKVTLSCQDGPGTLSRALGGRGGGLGTAHSPARHQVC